MPVSIALESELVKIPALKGNCLFLLIADKLISVIGALLALVQEFGLQL